MPKTTTKPIKPLKEPSNALEPTPQEDTPPSVTPLVDFPPESYGDGMRAAWRKEFEQD